MNCPVRDLHELVSQQKSDILRVIEGKNLKSYDEGNMMRNKNFATNNKEKSAGYNQALDELYKEIEKI